MKKNQKQWQTEIETHQTQHCEQCKFYQKKGGDSGTLCDLNCNQGKHRVWNGNQVCDDYEDGDEANKHIQTP